MIFISKYLVPKGYLGLTLYPFILLKQKTLKHDVAFMNHERIHLKQQLELLVLPFYLWYVLEFLVRLIQYKNWSMAYRNISFEREAYHQEKNLEYLKNRPFWAFLKYLRRHDISAGT
ncbi:membrane protein [Tamlana nanhaiensis]|uniref:Membrane protein n=1 Tax=Neotamlana nanhaiensis TaxID=1382798 RepID=A0A0D7W0P2_9FLAO|nr:hypothetical protein [Tamlana nanhaiensis]KJD32609.1 membrane protein [Tamlana nanhaiensis]